MMYKQGDIDLLPVAFSDLTNRKQRPVLVISSNSYNELTDDIVVVAITSQLRKLGILTFQWLLNQKI